MNLKSDENAVANILGMLLIILITIILGATLLLALQNDETVQAVGERTPISLIDIDSVEGGSASETYVHLLHKSGSDVFLNSTYIVINGKGSASAIVNDSMEYVEGDIVVRYIGLDKWGKSSSYAATNTILNNSLWSPGEILSLNGRDGNVSAGSSVVVSVNGFSGISAYSLKPGSKVTIMVIDSKSQRMVAENTALVQSVD